jgi:hypothetical protein
MATASFFDIAMKAHERFGALPVYNHAIQFIPLTDDYKEKKPADGFLPRLHVIPKNRNGIALMAGVYSDSNLGIRSHREIGAPLVLDIDEPGTLERMEREYGPLPLTYTTQTRPVSRPYKQHLYFLQTEHSAATFHKQITDITHTGGYDLKCQGGWGYVAAEGSVRDGEIITALHNVPMIPIPDSLVDFLRDDVRKYRALQRAQKKAAASVKMKPTVSTPATTAATEPKKFVVSRDDRYWVIKSRIKTWKNTGLSDDDVFDLLMKHIRLHFEDAESLLTPAYIKKLHTMIREVPTLGEVSYRNLTHRRRRRRRDTTPLPIIRERFQSCPSQITASDARHFFSIKSTADQRRLMREFHRHGYVALGSRGSHACIWSRTEPQSLLPSFPKNSLTKKKVSSITLSSSRRPQQPNLKKVCMSTQNVENQEFTKEFFIHTRYTESGENFAAEH